MTLQGCSWSPFRGGGGGGGCSWSPFGGGGGEVVVHGRICVGWLVAGHSRSLCAC